MALARLPYIESLRYSVPGEWGQLMELDRVPEARTPRGKIQRLAQENGPALWSAALCERWMAAAPEQAGVLYIDGQVRLATATLTRRLAKFAAMILDEPVEPQHVAPFLRRKAALSGRLKVSFVAAVALDEDGHPLRAELAQLPGFTPKAIAGWAGANLSPASTVISHGLACFVGVTDAGCAHQFRVVGGPRPTELPLFHRVNTVLGSVKTGLSGAYHAFGFGKYAERDLAVITYRFYRRFDLHALTNRLLAAAGRCGPRPERWIRMADTHC